MLPPAVLALVLMTTKVLASPQGLPLVQNLTIVNPPPAETSMAKVRLETTATGWEKIHLETTATGWQEIATIVAPETTSTPTIVDIHTEVADVPSPVGEIPEVAPTGQGRVERPNETPNNDGFLSSLPEQTSSGEDLLLDIITRIASPVSPTRGATAPDDNHERPPNSNHESEPSNNSELVEANPVHITAAFESVPAVTIGDQITLGSQVLTLTPGLSSIVGGDSTATYIAVTTDSVGQTLITVSSSGTAVTATITNAPVTITRPKTALEASITLAARPGNYDSTSVGSEAVPTSSKGAAASGSVDVSLWFHVGIGLAGLRYVVG